MPDNKFANSFAAIRQASVPEAAPDGVAEEDARPAPPVPPAATRPAESARPGGPHSAARTTSREQTRATAPVAVPEHRGPGRPPGKRSDPEYRQVTGLIRKDVHVAVLKQMLDEGRSRDMGALLEELLERHYLKRARRHDGSMA